MGDHAVQEKKPMLVRLSPEAQKALARQNKEQRREEQKLRQAIQEEEHGAERRAKQAEQEACRARIKAELAAARACDGGLEIAFHAFVKFLPEATHRAARIREVQLELRNANERVAQAQLSLEVAETEVRRLSIGYTLETEQQRQDQDHICAQRRALLTMLSEGEAAWAKVTATRRKEFRNRALRRQAVRFLGEPDEQEF